MKKKFLGIVSVIAVLVGILIFLNDTVNATGSGLASPACTVLATENEMIKHGLRYSGIEFTEEDFTNALGMDKISSITVESVPSAEDGRLTLNGIYVVENQVIPAENLGGLKFTATNSEITESSFTFSANESEYAISCTMLLTESVNFAPTVTVAEDTEVWTQKDITCFGSLTHKDPENDEVTYEIISYPEKGLLSLNSNTGEYCYTPYANVKGVDAFRYRVRDAYGNYSHDAKVNIEIDNVAIEVDLSDMTDDPAHNAAILAISKNLMHYTVNDGKYCFNPSGTVTREEFLVMTMDLFGAQDVPEIKSSGFTDDDNISTNAKGYVASAYFLGIVSGDIEGSKIYFRPKDAITKAEAAVMLNNILGVEPTISVSTFSDAEDVPVWAESSLCALHELGILEAASTGSIGANDTLSRAQVAQIIMSLIQYTGK